jgi:hypothetical protein
MFSRLRILLTLAETSMFDRATVTHQSGGPGGGKPRLQRNIGFRFRPTRFVRSGTDEGGQGSTSNLGPFRVSLHGLLVPVY